MKSFRYIKKEHLNGLGAWFWVKENFTFISDTTSDIWESFRHTSVFDLTLRDLGFLIFGIPTGFCIGLVIGPWLRRNEAYHSLEIGDRIIAYNKKNIEYFTLLDTLADDGSYNGN